MLTIITKSSILDVAPVLDQPLESKRLLLCTQMWKNDQLYDQLLLMQLEKKLSCVDEVRLLSPIQNRYLEKCASLFSNRRQTWVPNQLNKVYLYGSHVRWSQNTEHAKVSRYFTNKRKTRFDYQNSLNKKKSLNIFFWLNKKPCSNIKIS